MNNETEQPVERRQRSTYTLRKFGREMVAYGLGFAGLGVATAGIATGTPLAVAAGIAAGAGAMFGSREVIKPLYESPAESPRDESRWKRLGRGMMYTAGIAVTYVAGAFVYGAIGPAPIENWHGGERIVSGIIGTALLFPGQYLVNKSFDPNLYGEASAATPPSGEAEGTQFAVA